MVDEASFMENIALPFDVMGLPQVVFEGGIDCHASFLVETVGANLIRRHEVGRGVANVRFNRVSRLWARTMASKRHFWHHASQRRIPSLPRASKSNVRAARVGTCGATQ